MRELKFRAYGHLSDGTYKMLHNVSVRGNDGVPQLGGETVCDHELMQYTGLKDKNGKEIYEGDIVEHFGGYKWIAKVVWHNTGWYNLGWEEEYHDDDTGEHDPAHWQHHILSSYDTIRVIGNIHENPELLNGSGAAEKE